MTAQLDSRTSSILLNLNINVNASSVALKYISSKEDIEEASKGNKQKVYKSLRQTMNECYLTGSLKYGRNYIM